MFGTYGLIMTDCLWLQAVASIAATTDLECGTAVYSNLTLQPALDSGRLKVKQIDAALTRNFVTTQAPPLLMSGSTLTDCL